MRFSKLIVCVLATVLAFSSAGYAQQTKQAQPDAQRLSAAHTLLKASGAADLMIQSIKAALPAQRASLPQIPDEFWKKFEDRMLQEAPMLVDSVAVVYAMNFSLDELKGLTAFYNTPLGQRLRSAQPAIMAASNAIGQRWGTKIGTEVGASLQH